MKAPLLARDDARWITIRPGGKRTKSNGEKAKGLPVLIDSTSGKVLGGRFQGQVIGKKRKLKLPRKSDDAEKVVSSRAKDGYEYAYALAKLYKVGVNDVNSVTFVTDFYSKNIAKRNLRVYVFKTQDIIYGRYHDPSYWHETSRQRPGEELFANLFSLSAVNPKAYNAVKTVFSRTVEIFENSIKALFWENENVG